MHTTLTYEAQKAVLQERLRNAALAQRNEQPSSPGRLRLAARVGLPGPLRFRPLIERRVLPSERPDWR
jgi:hypothetical protein